MNNLPILTSSAPAKAPSRPAGKDEVAHEDTQKFGNVLAREVADTGKPADSNPKLSGKAAKQSGEQDNADTPPAVAADSSLSADMLATLLAQAAVPQTDAKAQLALNAQSGATVTSASGKTSKTQLAAGKDELLAAKPDMPLLETALPQIKNALKGNAKLTDTLSKNDLNLSNDTQNLRGGLINALTHQAANTSSLTGLTATASSFSIHTPVTQPAWGDEFGQKITWMANQRNQSAELHLNPPQLGPLDVVLKMNGDQATAMFTSPHAAVRDAIEQALPRLREMMADNGIMLGNATVSDQAARNNQDNSPRKSQGKLHDQLNAVEAASPQNARVTSISRHNGMVDTFA